MSTIDKFYEGYTLKQVTNLLQVIDDKKYEELAIRAKLHGVKIKPKLKAISMTKEQREEADKQAMDLLTQMQQEYKAKNG